MKTCPFCAEEIQDEAIVCKHCGRELAPEVVAFVTRGLAGRASNADAPTPENLQPKKPIWEIALSVGVVFAILQAIASCAAYYNGALGYDHLIGRLTLTIPLVSVAAAGITAMTIAIWRAGTSPHKAVTQSLDENNEPTHRPGATGQDLSNALLILGGLFILTIVVVVLFA